MCGEKASPYTLGCLCAGSPPRVRGKNRAQHVHRHVKGITPACAGKRSRSRRSRLHSWDHPRVCGEKTWQWQDKADIKGSPRVCGEKCAGIVALLIKVGSPPRVRGKVCIYIRLCGCVGITPACAGKRTTMMGRTRRFGDHPRVCGEKKITPSGAGECTGSPPRVRGKAFEQKQRARNNRITPACAGKSSQPRGFLGWP